MSGCSGSSGEERKSLTPYAQATIVPGTGIGDLQLGKTTLGWISNKLGQGKPAVLIGDEAAIELTYLDGQLALLFQLTGDCQAATRPPRQNIDFTRGLKAFLEQYPACDGLPLSSLSISSGDRNPTDAFFKGSTNQGVKLGSPIFEATKHGASQSNPGHFVAGESDTNNLDRLEFPGGIYFYYPAGEQPLPEEIMSGQPLSPERLQQLKESAKEAAKDPGIRRITIFAPN